ncbi:MAG: hypothetical protein ACD_20C00104G0007 [uncultured bacterium]|nr:MAG: hypothetical protein ACD_20C00104G0007 [uncultured bacterium]HBH18875.1 hypothetical protein [Cyanobacteria bacterium UBA9579]
MDILEFIFAPLIFILDLIAIFDIITGPKDTVKKVLWVIVILLLPVLGLILYYLIGKENLLGRTRQH